MDYHKDHYTNKVLEVLALEFHNSNNGNPKATIQEFKKALKTAVDCVDETLAFHFPEDAENILGE